MRRLVAMAGLIVVSASRVSPAQPPTLWDGIYTLAQSDRGNLEYRQHCSRCHGQFLEGKEGPPPPIPPDMPPATVGVGWEFRGNKPPLAGWRFRENWNAMAVADLFERTRVSMPQNAPGSLSRQQNADILAFILSQNGYPAGLTELPQNASTIADVRFTGW